ncbi:hypothetical protein BDZ91DRAFT_149014 [Kalaharituber pfeilii]|nr:hypothetical protein BDZ91DRAFT_149014 [Kalaharituber pfeilii]
MTAYSSTCRFVALLLARTPVPLRLCKAPELSRPMGVTSHSSLLSPLVGMPVWCGPRCPAAWRLRPLNQAPFSHSSRSSRRAAHPFAIARSFANYSRSQSP